MSANGIGAASRVARGPWPEVQDLPFRFRLARHEGRLVEFDPAVHRVSEDGASDLLVSGLLDGMGGTALAVDDAALRAETDFFHSSNLVSADTNSQSDIFLRSRAIAGGGVIGAGDGSGLPCPCGNAGGPGEGCASSLGRGASIGRYGTVRVGLDDMRFVGEQLIPGGLVMLFSGRRSLGAGAGIPFGDGIRCTGGGVRRHGSRVADSAGIATWGPGLAAQGAWNVGVTRYFQVWYQDTGSSPCGSGFNTSPAQEVSFLP